MRIVHLLNWKLTSIEKILDDIKKQEFDAIQINPMQSFKHDDEFHWWLSYQPLGFKLGNMYGNNANLTSLCDKAKEKGLDIIVDIICNHTANRSDDLALEPHETVDNELLNANCWKEKIQLTNGSDRLCATTQLIGLPGLDLRKDLVLSKIFKYLVELKKCGVMGLRFDAAKHIGLPNDDVYFFSIIKTLLDGMDMYAYGEFLGGNTPWKNELTQYLDILCGHTSQIDDINKHVTYIESHDTFLNDDNNSTKNITTKQLINLYDLLTYKFPKTIYYVRPMYYPYLPSGNKFNESNEYEIQSRDELNYFETAFLESNKIKIANQAFKKLQKRL